MRGIIIAVGIINMFYRIVISRNIPHPDAAVPPLIKTVEVIRGAEVPVERAGDYYPGIAVVTPVPVSKLKTDGTIKADHIHPDFILFPRVVVPV